jgi:hypothetical protein
MCAMLTRIGRRVFELSVALFAVLGFFYVPLGKKTGFEHAKAVFSTPAAREAGAELIEASRHVKDQLANAFRDPGPANARAYRYRTALVCTD